MEKECCNMKVTEIQDGIKIELTGEGIKDKCKVMMENCCDEKSVKKFVKSCCKPE